LRLIGDARHAFYEQRAPRIVAMPYNACEGIVAAWATCLLASVAFAGGAAHRSRSTHPTSALQV